MHEPRSAELWVGPAHLFVLAAEHAAAAQVLDRDQPGADAVVDVVVVVGDLVGEVGQLRLETGLQALQEPLAEFAELARIRGGAVLEDALAHFEREVEAGKLGVALLEFVHHAQRLQVVLEPAELAHAVVQRVLAGVAERACGRGRAPGRSPRPAAR